MPQLRSPLQLLLFVTLAQTNQNTSFTTGNVIFLHPDGTSSSHWGAARFLNYGSDTRGQSFPFAIWTGFADNARAILAKTRGMNASKMPP